MSFCASDDGWKPSSEKIGPKVTLPPESAWLRSGNGGMLPSARSAANGALMSKTAQSFSAATAWMTALSASRAATMFTSSAGVITSVSTLQSREVEAPCAAAAMSGTPFTQGTRMESPLAPGTAAPGAQLLFTVKVGGNGDGVVKPQAGWFLMHQ